MNSTTTFCFVLAILCAFAGVIEHLYFWRTPANPYRCSFFWPALGILILMLGHYGK